jgi:hypothetical protein
MWWLRNVGNKSPYDTASHPVRPEFSAKPLWAPLISRLFYESYGQWNSLILSTAFQHCDWTDGHNIHICDYRSKSQHSLQTPQKFDIFFVSLYTRCPKGLFNETVKLSTVIIYTCIQSLICNSWLHCGYRSYVSTNCIVPSTTFNW